MNRSARSHPPAGLRPRRTPGSRGRTTAAFLFAIILSAHLPDAAAQDAGTRPSSPPATDTLFVRPGGGEGAGGVRIRSFRGQDVRIIRRLPPPAAGITKGGPDSLEAGILRELDRRPRDPAGRAPARDRGTTVIAAPGATAVVPTRVETVYVERASAAPLRDTAAVASDTAATPPTPPVAERPAPRPAAPEVLVREVERSILEEGLFTAVDVIFEFNKSRLMPRSHAILNAVGQVLVAHPGIEILIGGHTDSIGSAAYNLKLSAARAASARAYLLSHFPEIAPERIATEGFGLAKPVADNASETGRALNRRVEFRVTKNPGR